MTVTRIIRKLNWLQKAVVEIASVDAPPPGKESVFNGTAIAELLHLIPGGRLPDCPLRQMDHAHRQYYQRLYALDQIASFTGAFWYFYLDGSGLFWEGDKVTMAYFAERSWRETQVSQRESALYEVVSRVSRIFAWNTNQFKSQRTRESDVKIGIAFTKAFEPVSAMLPSDCQ